MLSQSNEDMCLKNERISRLRKSHSRHTVNKEICSPLRDCSMGMSPKTLCTKSEHTTTTTTKKVTSPRMCLSNFVSLSQRSLFSLSKISLLSQSQKSLRGNNNDNDSFASASTMDLFEDLAGGTSSEEAPVEPIVVEWGTPEEEQSNTRTDLHQQQSQKNRASISLQKELDVLLDGIESITPDSNFWSSALLDKEEWTETASLGDSVFGMTSPCIKKASIWNAGEASPRSSFSNSASSSRTTTTTSSHLVQEWDDEASITDSVFGKTRPCIPKAKIWLDVPPSQAEWCQSSLDSVYDDISAARLCRLNNKENKRIIENIIDKYAYILEDASSRIKIHS